MVNWEDDRYLMEWDAKRSIGLHQRMNLGAVVDILDNRSLILINGILSSCP
jgi:hypothetical protein